MAKGFVGAGGVVSSLLGVFSEQEPYTSSVVIMIRGTSYLPVVSARILAPRIFVLTNRSSLSWNFSLLFSLAQLITMSETLMYPS